MEWWEKYPERFIEELEKMEECTNAEFLVVEGSQLPGGFGSGPHLAWAETLTSNSGRRYRIIIVCQRVHPYSAPAAWILEPTIERQHHMLSDARLCLHDASIGPDKTYVLNIRNWACEWIYRYETGKWRTFS